MCMCDSVCMHTRECVCGVGHEHERACGGGGGGVHVEGRKRMPSG